MYEISVHLFQKYHSKPRNGLSNGEFAIFFASFPPSTRSDSTGKVSPRFPAIYPLIGLDAGALRLRISKPEVSLIWVVDTPCGVYIYPTFFEVTRFGSLNRCLVSTLRERGNGGLIVRWILLGSIRKSDDGDRKKRSETTRDPCRVGDRWTFTSETDVVIFEYFKIESWSLQLFPRPTAWSNFSREEIREKEIRAVIDDPSQFARWYACFWRQRAPKEFLSLGLLLKSICQGPLQL